MDDYFKHHKVELHQFVDNYLHDVALEILPAKEKKYLDDVDTLESIFIIEKFLYGMIYPQKWKVEISSEFNYPSGENENKRLKQIIKLLKTGDVGINSKSYNFLPKSSRSYLKAYKSTAEEKRRYVVDFSNSFFGIKHIHLNQKHDDNLLFYTNDEDTIYFLRTGNHWDIYNKKNVEIIINEFPYLLDILKIFPLPDISTGEKEHSLSEIKQLWESGITILLNINGVLYSGTPQTFSNLTTSNISTAQNLFFQLEDQLMKIINHAKESNKKIDLRLLRSKSKLSVKEGAICYRERNSGQEYELAPIFLKTASIAIHLNNLIGT